MALLKWGMIVVDGRGKLGGHVLTKNRQGAAARTKVTPINRRTTEQQNIRGLFTTDSQAWRGLTDSQRDQWDSAAQDFSKHNIFGDAYNPTGKNLHMLINQNLRVVGSSPVTAPPTPTPADGVLTASVASNTAAAQTLAYTATPLAANMNMAIWATRPLSAGIATPGSRFRLLQIEAPASASPADTFAAYEAKFGTPVVGKRIFWKLQITNGVSGIKSGGVVVDGVTT